MIILKYCLIVLFISNTLSEINLQKTGIKKQKKYKKKCIYSGDSGDFKVILRALIKKIIEYCSLYLKI